MLSGETSGSFSVGAGEAERENQPLTACYRLAGVAVLVDRNGREERQPVVFRGSEIGPLPLPRPAGRPARGESSAPATHLLVGVVVPHPRERTADSRVGVAITVGAGSALRAGRRLTESEAGETAVVVDHIVPISLFPRGLSGCVPATLIAAIPLPLNVADLAGRRNAGAPARSSSQWRHRWVCGIVAVDSIYRTKHAPESCAASGGDRERDRRAGIERGGVARCPVCGRAGGGPAHAVGRRQEWPGRGRRHAQYDRLWGAGADRRELGVRQRRHAHDGQGGCRRRACLHHCAGQRPGCRPRRRSSPRPR